MSQFNSLLDFITNSFGVPYGYNVVHSLPRVNLNIWTCTGLWCVLRNIPVACRNSMYVIITGLIHYSVYGRINSLVILVLASAQVPPENIVCFWSRLLLKSSARGSRLPTATTDPAFSKTKHEKIHCPKRRSPRVVHNLRAACRTCVSVSLTGRVHEKDSSPEGGKKTRISNLLG